jgi:hypothetical protein
MAIPLLAFGALAAANGGSVFSSDGSSLAGWTNSGVTVSATIGNPAPSFSAVPTAQNAHIQIANLTSFAGRTMQFDAMLANTNALLDVFFACNSSGQGLYLRLDSRTANACGISTATGWTTGVVPSGTTFSTTDASWHTYKIVFNGAGTAIDVYKDGVQVISARASTLQGNYIGLWSDAGSNGGYLDNILIS